MIPNTFSLSKFLLIAYNFFLLLTEIYRQNKSFRLTHFGHHQNKGCIFLRLCMIGVETGRLLWGIVIAVIFTKIAHFYRFVFPQKVLNEDKKFGYSNVRKEVHY